MWNYKIVAERQANYSGDTESTLKITVEEEWSGADSEAKALAYMFRTIMFGMGFSPKTIDETIPDPEGGEPSYEEDREDQHEESAEENGEEEIPTIIPDEVA